MSAMEVIFGSNDATVVCLPLLLCYASVVLYWVFLAYQLQADRDFLMPLRKACAQARAYVRPRPGDGKFEKRQEQHCEKHVLESKVKESVQSQRVRLVQKYAGPMAHLAAWYTFFVGLLQLTSSTCSQRGLPLSFASAELLQAFVWFAICSVFTCSPRLVTVRSIEAVYVGCTCWWLLRVWLVEDSDVMLAITKASMWRAVTGILVCNAGLTSVCNGMLMVGHVVALALRAVSASERDQRARHIQEEVATTFFIICVLFFFEGWVWAACRHTLEVKASSQAEVTVRKLLSALCDAVVTLGPDLRISERAPKLANLLLQGRSTSALEGFSFMDFMAPGDQARFRQFLARAPDNSDARVDPEPAQALNVHLRDSSGITVQVQLFHSHFLDLNDEMNHLIGICEVGDTGGARVGALEAAPLRGVQRAPQSEGAVSLCSLSDSETLFEDSASVVFAQNDAFAPRIGGAQDPPRLNSRTSARVPPREVSLQFDTLCFKVMDRSAPVIDASLLDKESLLQWVADWTSCKSWMQDLVNAVLRPVNSSSWPGRGGPPTALSFQVSFRGSCGLPPDILTRTPILTENPQGVTNIGPPQRLSISRVRLQRLGREYLARAGSADTDLSGGTSLTNLTSRSQVSAGRRRQGSFRSTGDLGTPSPRTLGALDRTAESQHDDSWAPAPAPTARGAQRMSL